MRILFQDIDGDMVGAEATEIYSSEDETMEPPNNYSVVVRTNTGLFTVCEEVTKDVAQNVVRKLFESGRFDE